jgi:hypoxanthine phosphoribosyltransferase
MIKCNKPFIKEAKHIKFDELTQFSEFENLKLKEYEYIILVDDYIGSGETLFACIKKILSINPDLTKKIIIATIAIQHDTVDKISYPIHYINSVKKGISDFYTSPEKEKHINTMKKLESRLISGRNFSLGYEQSEGLVTMMRTPDNTFPIFWHDYKKSTNLHPPFPRE